MLTFGTDNPNL